MIRILNCSVPDLLEYESSVNSRNTISYFINEQTNEVKERTFERLTTLGRF